MPGQLVSPSAENHHNPPVRSVCLRPRGAPTGRRGPASPHDHPLPAQFVTPDPGFAYGSLRNRGLPPSPHPSPKLWRAQQGYGATCHVAQQTCCSLCCNNACRRSLSCCPASWWRRGESNPRPKQSHYSIYVCILPLSLVATTAGGQGHRGNQRSVSSCLSPRAHGLRTSLLSSPRPAQQASAARRHGI